MAQPDPTPERAQPDDELADWLDDLADRFAGSARTGQLHDARGGVCTDPMGCAPRPSEQPAEAAREPARRSG